MKVNFNRKNEEEIVVINKEQTKKENDWSLLLERKRKEYKAEWV